MITIKSNHMHELVQIKESYGYGNRQMKQSIFLEFLATYCGGSVNVLQEPTCSQTRDYSSNLIMVAALIPLNNVP